MSLVGRKIKCVFTVSILSHEQLAADVLQVVLFVNSVSVLVVLGKMRSAIGSAQLLISQKFQQFRELCEENLVSLEHPHTHTENMQAIFYNNVTHFISV